jgi:hypothetical protein
MQVYNRENYHQIVLLENKIIAMKVEQEKIVEEIN